MKKNQIKITKDHDIAKILTVSVVSVKSKFYTVVLEA